MGVLITLGKKRVFGLGGGGEEEGMGGRRDGKEGEGCKGAGGRRREGR